LPVAKEPNPIVAESHSFASAIEPWHRTHDASAALALLDAHERRYPNGHMRLETRVLRAEIYLAQGRETEALAVLDGVALSGVPRARELQTVRGELRIKAGRCPEGKRDLGDVLEKSVADSLAKRAAQALHHCP
jgi:outer membrane PBP1 activator LpoA protein